MRQLIDRLLRRAPGRATAPASAADAIPASLVLGMRNVAEGRLAEAARVAHRLEQQQEPAQAAFLRAHCAEAAGDDAVRRAELERAAALDPDEPAYAIELAKAQAEAGALAAAIARLRAVLAAADGALAGDADLNLLLARWCHAAGDRPGTVAALDKVVDARPGFVEAAIGLADLLPADGAGDRRARAVLQRATDAGGSDSLRLRAALRLPVAYRSAADIDAARERLDAELAALETRPDLHLARPELEFGSTAFLLAFHGRDDRALLARLGTLVRRGYREAAAGVARPAPDGARARIRLAIVCACLWQHSVGRALLPILEHLDRTRFEVHLLAVPGQPQDAMTARLVAAADTHVVLPASVPEAAAAIAALAPDIVLYPEIGMHPFVYLLAHWRLAPLQCALAGHPETSGVDSIDAYLSDGDAEPPDGASHYVERMVRVAGGFLPIADLPAGPDPAIRPAAGRYLCCQTLVKLHPDFDDLLAGVLKADRDATITLFGDADPAADRLVLERLHARLGSGSERITLLARQDYRGYLATLNQAAVVLDTPHFGGGNTTLEALALQVPVITLPGRFLRGRFAATRLRALGLADCVAADAAHYAELAVETARSPARRANIVERLRAGGRATLDGAGPARAFNQALLALAHESRRSS